MISIILTIIGLYLLIGLLPLALIIGGIVMDEEPSIGLFVSFAFFWPLFLGKLLLRVIMSIAHIPSACASLFGNTKRLLRKL